MRNFLRQKLQNFYYYAQQNTQFHHACFSRRLSSIVSSLTRHSSYRCQESSETSCVLFIPALTLSASIHTDTNHFSVSMNNTDNNADHLTKITHLSLDADFINKFDEVSQISKYVFVAKNTPYPMPLTFWEILFLFKKFITKFCCY